MSQTAQEVADGFAGKPLHRARALWRKFKTPPAGDTGAQRWRNIFISLGSALSSRVIAFVCSLLMIPIALRYLGSERYGVWITLTSSVNLLGFFDFGIGIGLQNRVSEMMGKGQLDQLTRCLRSTFVVLFSIAGLLFAILAGVIFWTNASTMFFHGAAFATIDLQGVLVLIAGAFMLGLPLTLFTRLAFGLQQGWIASLAASCGTAFSLLAVFVSSFLHVNFTVFVALTVIPPIAAQAVGYFILSRRVPGGLPILGPVVIDEGLQILRHGSHYVLPQIAGAIITQGPTVFLGTMSSPLNAATYSILARISLPLQQLQQMFLAQIWPALTEAMHRGDTVWLSKTMRRTLRSTMAFGSFTVCFVIFAVLLLFPMLAKDATLKPTTLIVILYAVHVGIMCVVQGLSYMINGLSLMRLPNILAAISIIFAFAILPFAAKGFGTTGVLLAMLGLNCLVTIPLLYRVYSQYLSRNEAR